MIGGEGPINDKWMIEGQMIEYAKQFRGMAFLLEHRYYGSSHPTLSVFQNSKTNVFSYYECHINILFKL
jgi:hypothetical protein